MAANFWTSSHSKQLLDADEVNKVHQLDQHLGFSLEDCKVLKIQVCHKIQEVAKHVKVRQRVVATAIAYFRRVYVKKSFAELDPRVVGPTCLYLASKAEECTVQAKLLVFYLKKVYNSELWGSVEIKDILEMEMHLLEALDCFLVIYHPYRPLVNYLQDTGMYNDLLETCWSLLNDSYKTNICLMYAPYMIALASIYLACVLREKDLCDWFEDLRIDMRMIRNITTELLDYYEHYTNVVSKEIDCVLAKLAQVNYKCLK